MPPNITIELTGAVSLLSNVVALLVIIEKVLSLFRNWNGNPDVRVVQQIVQLLDGHLVRIDGSLQSLISKLR